MAARRPRSAPRAAKAAPRRRRIPGTRPYLGTPFDLTGRTALVTGASRGLGAAMAHALAQAGADLILWGRDTRALAQQASRCEASGARILAQGVDVTDGARVRRAVRSALGAFKRIDILVNNAGIWRGDAARTLTRRDWDRVLETNLTAAFFVSQTVAASMARRRYGKVINISSTSAVLAHQHGAVYGSAKAALMHLTRILALEWGPIGVRVTGIAPGLFRTPMTRDVFSDRGWVTRRSARIPLRRFGEPEDLAGLVVFLASAASDHITGQTIIADGGASLIAE